MQKSYQSWEINCSNLCQFRGPWCKNTEEPLTKLQLRADRKYKQKSGHLLLMDLDSALLKKWCFSLHLDSTGTSGDFGPKQT